MSPERPERGEKAGWPFLLTFLITWLLAVLTTSCGAGPIAPNASDDKTAGPIAPNVSDDKTKGTFSVSLEVSEPVVLGKPFRMQGIAINHDDVPRAVRLDPGEIILEFEGKDGATISYPLFKDGWKMDEWKTPVVVPPDKTVPCFDRMVSTGLQWHNPIFIRGRVRLSWKACFWKETDPPHSYESKIVRSKPFEICLEDPTPRDKNFAVNGLQLLVEPVKPKVAARNEVAFLVKLKNVGDKPIRISGREKFDDNYCCFLIYAPGEQVPVSQGVDWPTSGTQGLVIPPGKSIEREFKAAWGVQDILEPGGPRGHVGHSRKETTFVTPGIHSIIVYFHGEDMTKNKDSWTGYIRSNVVTVDLIARAKP